MRIIIFTGKGGVGKTSVSAATALRLADLGYRTLVMSTDPAHSLSDSLDMPVQTEPMKVAPNLWALETNAYVDFEKNWGTVREHFAEIMSEQGMNQMLANETAILPGMEELFSLTRIKDYYQSDQFDIVVVDAAPTGETLRLLSMPQALHWIVRLVRGLESTFVRPLVRPLVSLSPGLNKYMASERVYAEVDGMFDKLETMRKILSDTTTTSVRIVMNAEKMSIKESKRALTYLNLYELLVDSVVVNRLLPAGQDSGYLEHWKGVQHRYLNEIEESFAPLPIFRAPMYGGEVVGLDCLRRLADDLYADCDPAKHQFIEKPFEMQYADHSYRVRVRLPFLEEDKLETWISGDELVIQIGSQRRMVGMPTSLIGLEPSYAEYQDGWLSICFELPVAVA